MNDNDGIKLVRAYEEELLKERTAYWKSREEYITHHLEIVEKYFAGRLTADQIKIWLSLLYDPVMLGIYEAFAQSDMEFLNDVLYQSACIKQVKNIHGTGTDHSFYSMHILPELLASNMISRIPLLVPEELGISSNGHIIAVSVMNLFMALWYKREDFAAKARLDAEKCLSFKQPIQYKAEVSYLLALLNEDWEDASEQLYLICQGKKRSAEFGETKFSKSFCMEAHAFYNLAHHISGGALDEKIRMPEQSNFCQKLALWQRDNGYKTGSLFLNYPQPIELIHTILSVVPPQTSLYQPYLNEKGKNRLRYEIDADTFLAQMTAAVLSALGPEGN